MSCTDICIDMDSDYSDNSDFHRQKIVTARREHKCGECGSLIKIGEKYQRASGKSDREMWTFKTCTSCVEIRSTFVCGAFYYGGLWDHIEEEMFPEWERLSPIDCLARLETLTAREKMRARYAEWQK